MPRLYIKCLMIITIFRPFIWLAKQSHLININSVFTDYILKYLIIYRQHYSLIFVNNFKYVSHYRISIMDMGNYKNMFTANVFMQCNFCYYQSWKNARIVFCFIIAIYEINYDKIMRYLNTNRLYKFMFRND